MDADKRRFKKVWFGNFKWPERSPNSGQGPEQNAHFFPICVHLRLSAVAFNCIIPAHDCRFG
jgi:hypothetical protein